MKTRLHDSFIALALLAFSTLNLQLSTCFAQGTAFTYQGRLNNGGTPANGSYDLRFTIYDSTNSPGTIIARPLTNSAVDVSNGLFTTTLDFGTGMFDGNPRWLEISVQKNGGGFTTLSPRQQVSPAPYAIFATTASNLLDGLTIQQNTNDAPNIIGGSSVNYVSSGVIGATIAGGGATNYFFSPNINNNSVTANFGTVGGGIGNTASGIYATVSGGVNNTASGAIATVSGGDDNIASGDYSFAAGAEAQALHYGSFVWSDSSGGTFASTANNQFSVRALGGIRLAGDVQLSGGASYHNLSLSGGNALGYLYGAYPTFGDGIHLGYNYYADANGSGQVNNTGGATSRLTTGYGFVGIYVGGVNAAPNTQRLLANSTGVTVNGTFNNSSDRNAKQDFTTVSSSRMLEKVTRLPISEWSYKEDPKTRHVGPMGQDFYSTFNIGTDEKHIAPIDEGGIALAAIQGLNQKVDEKEARIQEQAAEITDLKTRLATLEKIILNQKSN